MPAFPHLDRMTSARSGLGTADPGPAPAVCILHPVKLSAKPRSPSPAHAGAGRFGLQTLPPLPRPPGTRLLAAPHLRPRSCSVPLPQRPAAVPVPGSSPPRLLGPRARRGPLPSRWKIASQEFLISSPEPGGTAWERAEGSAGGGRQVLRGGSGANAAPAAFIHLPVTLGLRRKRRVQRGRQRAPGCIARLARAVRDGCAPRPPAVPEGHRGTVPRPVSVLTPLHPATDRGSALGQAGLLQHCPRVAPWEGLVLLNARFLSPTGANLWRGLPLLRISARGSWQPGV